MSYYYSYYIGFQDDKGEIYPMGPFDDKGRLRPVLDRSSSFASDLHKDFYAVKDEMVTPELKNCFSYKSYDGKEIFSSVKYCPLAEMPNTDYILKGYFLTENLEAREKENGYFDEEELIAYYLTPEQYTRRFESELKFGPPQPQVDEEGNTWTEHSMREYSYSAIPLYHSKEYESFIICKVAQMLEAYDRDVKIVVLETEG